MRRQLLLTGLIGVFFVIILLQGDPTTRAKVAWSGIADSLGVRGDPESIPDINGMAYIPPGEFIMGSAAEDLDDVADISEYPQRRVYVDGFYIDVFEVTNIQYKVFIDSMDRRAPSHWRLGRYEVGLDGYPVVNVSWKDAVAYAEFMGKRLPTEEEWEKAARGSDGRRYPWGDTFDNKKANNGNKLMPVRQFPDGRSPYGLFDMAGNVSEWVDAWYAPYPIEGEDPIHRVEKFKRYKPQFGKNKYRVYRGGSWNNFPKFLRCANRGKARPNERWRYIGFRCVMDPPWKTQPPRSD
jgi:iron(II)-dependent oxidoreductase